MTPSQWLGPDPSSMASPDPSAWLNRWSLAKEWLNQATLLRQADTDWSFIRHHAAILPPPLPGTREETCRHQTAMWRLFFTSWAVTNTY